MDRRVTHGESYNRVYNIWAMMRQRCNNPNAANYHWYGGRGVSCDERWAKFSAFLEDMGYPPNPKAKLDRIDSNKGYSKDNCRWVDDTAQARNRRNNVNLTAFGKTQCISAWAEETGMTRDQIRHRVLTLGMVPEQALTAERMSWVQRRVQRTSLDGSNAQVFDSLADAAKRSEVKKGSLWAALKRQSPVSYSGYLWEYVE
jgi:hypothetical protein